MWHHAFHDFTQINEFNTSSPQTCLKLMIRKVDNRFISFMQNTNNISYINKNKVINIKSEILCREAEDDFFYFNKVNVAYKKLKEAVTLTPFHLKSVILLADIHFIKGQTKKALELYLRAEEISASNARVLAAIANCNYVLGNYTESLFYCERAIEKLDYENYALFSQIFEIKINILMEQKKYKQAYIAFIQAQNILDNTSLRVIYNINYELLSEKISLQKRIQKSNLQIV